MQVSAHGVATPDMVHSRPRGPTTSSSRHPVPSEPTGDSLTDTQVRRAVSRSAPAAVGIVVTGDNHLSSSLSGYTPERRAERLARLRAGFSTTVDYALQHGARLFVIAGDLFDTPTPSNAERAYVASELARLRRANVICVGVTGMSDSPRVAATTLPHTVSGGRPHGEANAAESPYATYAALDSLIYFPATALLAPRLISLGELQLAVVGISTNPAAPAGSDPLAEIEIADPEGVLSRAHVGLLIVHAGVEGFARPADEERILTRSNLRLLPPVLRIVVAGHVHRFGRARVDEREIIVPGSTERMDFDSQPGSSGFAWLEVTPDGLTRVKRVAVVEQSRADVELPTSRLFPAQRGAPERRRRTPPATVPVQQSQNLEAATEGAASSFYRLPAPTEPAGNGTARASNGPAIGGANGHDAPARPAPEREQMTSDLLETVRSVLDGVASDDTLVRLRLVGPITREQYHRLPLRQIREYGARRAFAFELDTSGLQEGEPDEPTSATAGFPLSSDERGSGGGGPRIRRAPVASGPLTPSAEVERLLAERLTQAEGNDPAAVADLHAAAQILLARLQASGGPNDREA